MEHEIWKDLGIRPEVYAFCRGQQTFLRPVFDRIEEIAAVNTARVLAAFQEFRVEESCFNTTTGYGYDDLGRDKLEQIYARLFGTEDAIVRPQILCGTHALTIALFGVLRPGDTVLFATGEPYDTIQGVAGLREEAGSLAEYGIRARVAPLDAQGMPDIEAIVKALTPDVRMVEIQRSRGYSTRPSYSVEQIGQIIRRVKELRPDVCCMVDNCYGEFTETCEPSHVGADLTVGSLIKNPGGGLAPVGAYLVGSREYIQMAAVRMSAPGLGKEQGPTLGLLRSFYQGLFEAPTVVSSALKTAVLAARLFEEMGFQTSPAWNEERHDIVQTVTFGAPEPMISFMEGIQASSPVDSFVSPIPWDMPGYDCQVIMAAGNFISGSTMELSADGPLRKPYTAFLQGALTWEHGQIALMKAVSGIWKA